MSDLWMPIEITDGYYQVSNTGCVRRWLMDQSGHKGGNTFQGRLVKQVLQSNGYLYVKLHWLTYERTITVHSLVAAAFLGTRPVGFEINHKDLDKSNNCDWNLEYVTPKQNMASHPNTRLTDADRLEIRQLYLEGYGTQQSLADKFGVSRSYVSDLTSGRR